MTFTRFEEIIKEKYPKAVVTSHRGNGRYCGNNGNATTVCMRFNGEYSKTYKYNGTYCDILNKLGIKTIYKHDYDALITAFNKEKENNDDSGIIALYSQLYPYLTKDEVIEKAARIHTNKIADYTNRLNDIELNYIIV
jgi:hypothetical protein